MFPLSYWSLYAMTCRCVITSHGGYVPALPSPSFISAARDPAKTVSAHTLSLSLVMPRQQPHWCLHHFLINEYIHFLSQSCLR
jgi:hypothetical protein